MLTIQNIKKIYGEMICGWEIERVKTTNTAYIFTLIKPNDTLEVNLERRWSDFNDKKYELWYWKNRQPESLNFEINAFQSPNRFLNAINLLLM